MATVARIESSLGFRDTEFTAGIARAEQRAATFSNRAGRAFANAFKRDPTQRAENALVGLATNMASGDIAGGVASFANSITALPLVIGAAVGTGAVLFEKLRTHIKETEKASQELHETTRKPLQFVVDSGQAEAYMASLSKQVDVLREKYQSGWQQFLDVAKYSPFAGSKEKEETAARQREINEADQRMREIALAAGRRELTQARVLAGLAKDPQRKALAEARFKFAEREAALRASPDKGTAARLDALEIERQEFEKNYKLGKAMRSQEFEDAKKLLMVQRMRATPEEKEKITASLKLRATMRQLERKDLTPEESTSLKLQKISQENDLLALNPKTKANKNPYAFGTIANREWEANVGAEGKGGFGSIARRASETNDPTAWGSLAHSAAQRGEIPLPGNEDQTAAVVAELKEMKGLMAKFVGD